MEKEEIEEIERNGEMQVGIEEIREYVFAFYSNKKTASSVFSKIKVLIRKKLVKENFEKTVQAIENYYQHKDKKTVGSYKTAARPLFDLLDSVRG